MYQLIITDIIRFGVIKIKKKDFYSPYYNSLKEKLYHNQLFFNTFRQILGVVERNPCT